MTRSASDDSTKAGTSTEPSRDPLAQKVWAERYEIRRRIGFDELYMRYAAFDQETERTVQLSVIRPELLTHKAERERARIILHHRAGIGGAHLLPLLDVDREGGFVFAVEPLEDGASLRAVLDQRSAIGETLSLDEALEIVFALESAMRAIPLEMSHGHVCAEHVLVMNHRLALTSPFLLHATSQQALRDAILGSPAWQRTIAPEVRNQGLSRAADLWGAACIVLEALTGSTQAGGHDALRHAHPDVADALARLLAPAPADRPASLEPLMNAIAMSTRATIPPMDPAPFQHALRRPSAPMRGAADADATVEMEALEDLEPPPTSQNTVPLVAMTEDVARAVVPQLPTPPPPRPSQRPTLPGSAHTRELDTGGAQSTRKLSRAKLDHLLSASEPSGERPSPAPADATRPLRSLGREQAEQLDVAAASMFGAAVPQRARAVDDPSPTPSSMLQLLPSVEVRKSLFAPPPSATQPLRDPTAPIPLVAVKSAKGDDVGPPVDVSTVVRDVDRLRRNRGRAFVLRALVVGIVLIVLAVGLALWKRSLDVEHMREERLRQDVLNRR